VSFWLLAILGKGGKRPLLDSGGVSPLLGKKFESSGSDFKAWRHGSQVGRGKLKKGVHF